MNQELEDPFRSPNTTIPGRSSDVPGNEGAGTVGFALSMVGVVGVLLVGLQGFGTVGFWIAAAGLYLSFLSAPGLLVSIAASVHAPRRVAASGIAIGAFGLLYLPTLALALLL